MYTQYYDKDLQMIVSQISKAHKLYIYLIKIVVYTFINVKVNEFSLIGHAYYQIMIVIRIFEEVNLMIDSIANIRMVLYYRVFLKRP